MTWADITNGAYEAIGGLMVLNHCRVLMRDKAVAGVSILSVIVFTTWGFWNLYYYPSLEQWGSFFGGALIVFANSLWVALLIRYRKPRSEQTASVSSSTGA